MDILLFILGLFFIILGINFFKSKWLKLLAGNFWGDENNNVNSKAAKKMGKVVSPGIIIAGVALLFYAFEKSKIADILVIAAIVYSLIIVVIVYINYAKN
ncbi:DUF3784 domain-containing protein (plasmid) [Lactobacillus salivarius]|uniref:DUF3784 domain-containing protein n=2 Tax=Ligilactobacillus salivarius TaxID=1624 RepID=A0A6A8LP25_9LACO|nr:DUF3784 domain-containing protein [Ligilactobacillus salivarius]MSE06980.1 DUF3784 domain-containing protein [Ligilactobacillus salivarius]